MFSTNAAWILLLLAFLMLLFNYLAPGKFLTEFNVRTMATNVSVLLVIAVGETFVMATGGIDLSVGYVLLFSGVTSAQVMNWAAATRPTTAGTSSFWVSLSRSAPVSPGRPERVDRGQGQGARPHSHAGHTRHVMGPGGDPEQRPGPSLPAQHHGRHGASRIIDKIPLVVIVAAIVAVIGSIILSLTRFGRYTLAIGSNQEAARRAGINVDRHLIKVYAMSGTLAGFAAFMNLAIFTTTTISGHANDNLQAIAAVVIGGTSLVGGVATIAGTTIGICIPMVLFSGFTILGLQSFWRDVAVGAVLILAVYTDQLRRRRRERH